MAGFLTTPLSFNGTFANTSGTLLRFGEQCFDVLAWTVITAIGRRNVYGYLVSAGAMQMMSSIGTLIGAVSGHITNDFVHTDFFVATGFALTMVFAFFAFLWCGFRTFSFTDAIESVTAVSHPSSGEQGEPAGGSLVGRRKTPAAGIEGGFAHTRDAVRATADDRATLANATTTGDVTASAASMAPSGKAERADRHEPGRSACKESPVQRHAYEAHDESDAAMGEAAGATPNASGEASAARGQGEERAATANGDTAGKDIENESAREALAAAPAPNQLDENCARLSDEFGLTAREREVFGLLAHGRNGRYIMDHLVISRNTAKSHIKHIYSKLGVHSHQELIDLATSGESR